MLHHSPPVIRASKAPLRRDFQTLAFIGLGIALTVTAGCGGGLSQNEMLEAAKRRAAALAAAKENQPANSDIDSEASETSSNGTQAEARQVATQTDTPGSQRRGSTPPKSDTPNSAIPKTLPLAQTSIDAARNSLPSREELFGPPRKYSSDQERHEQAVANIKRIGKALELYRREQGTYPLPSFAPDNEREPTLSWRVQILPHLGYERLFKLFRPAEPWDSPHNKQLLALIPPEFQSPERLDETTNYQVPLGTQTLFPGTKRISSRHVEDGLKHTVMLMEVDDSAAVPWTQPADWNFQGDAPLRGLGQLRPGGFLVVWGEGMVSYVSSTTPSAVVTSMFTRDRGEPFEFSQVHHEPLEALQKAARPDPASLPGSGSEQVAAASTSKTRHETDNPRVPGTAMTNSTSSGLPGGPSSRMPPPSEGELHASMKLLQDIYEAEYREARTRQARGQLARKLLTTSSKLDQDPQGRFATLQLASRVASEAGDVDVALEAIELIHQDYDVNRETLQLETLRQIAGTKPPPQGSTRLADTAYKLVLALIDQDRYDEAEEAYRIGITAARNHNNSNLVERFQNFRATLSDARSAYNRVRDHLSDPEIDDPAASLAVGSYFSFVKHDWHRGLPYLAQGSDAELRAIAEEELAVAGSQDFLEPLGVADDWWDLAERSRSNREAMHRHAFDWYQRLVAVMPEGLQKVKVEMRMVEYRKLYELSRP